MTDLEKYQSQINEQAVVIDNFLIVKNEGLFFFPVKIAEFISIFSKKENESNPNFNIIKLPVTKELILKLISKSDEQEKDEQYFVDKYSVFQCEHEDVLNGIRKLIIDTLTYEIDEKTRTKMNAYDTLNQMLLNLVDTMKEGYLSSMAKKREKEFKNKLNNTTKKYKKKRKI